MPEERSSTLQLDYAARVTAQLASGLSKGSPSTTAVRQHLRYQQFWPGHVQSPTALQLHCPREGAKQDHARRHDLTKKSNTALGEISVHPGRKDPKPLQSQVPPVATGQARRRNQFRVPLHEGRFGIEQVAVGAKIVYGRPHHGRFYSTRFRHGLEERRGRLVHHKTSCFFAFDGLFCGGRGCGLC